MDCETLKILKAEQKRLEQESFKALKVHRKYPRKLKPRIAYETATARLMEVEWIAFLHNIDLNTGKQIIKNN